MLTAESRTGRAKEKETTFPRVQRDTDASASGSPLADDISARGHRGAACHHGAIPGLCGRW